VTRRPAALLLAAVLVVPACTTRTADPAEAAPPATSPAATTTTVVTTTTPPPPPRAKDGGDIGACRDGVCEVRLTRRTVIPVDPAAGISEVAVESIVGNAVTAAITLATGHFSVGCTGDRACRTSLVGTTPPVVFATAHPGAQLSVNKVVLSVPAAADGTAIVALSRG
jgi:ABC-type amino acid transport substrate-binding protein